MALGDAGALTLVAERMLRPALDKCSFREWSSTVDVVAVPRDEAGSRAAEAAMEQAYREADGRDALRGGPDGAWAADPRLRLYAQVMRRVMSCTMVVHYFLLLEWFVKGARRNAQA